VPWATAVRSLGLVLDSKLLFSRHLHTVANKATGGWCNVFLLLAPDPTLTQSNKLTLYKLLIRSTLTHAAPVCISTSPSNYLTLQLSSQSVSESSVITPGVPPLPIYTTLYTLSPSPLSSTDLQPNFLLTAPHTPTPSPTNGEWYSSRLDKQTCTRNTNITDRSTCCYD
jgi:hypothetical protein